MAAGKGENGGAGRAAGGDGGACVRVCWLTSVCATSVPAGRRTYAGVIRSERWPFETRLFFALSSQSPPAKRDRPPVPPTRLSSLPSHASPEARASTARAYIARSSTCSLPSHPQLASRTSCARLMHSFLPFTQICLSHIAGRLRVAKPQAFNESPPSTSSETTFT